MKIIGIDGVSGAATVQITAEEASLIALGTKDGSTGEIGDESRSISGDLSTGFHAIEILLRLSEQEQY